MKKLFLGLEILIKESPDYININGHVYWWKSKGAITFIILSDNNDNSVLIYNLPEYQEVTHRKMLETLFNTMLFTKLNLAQLIEANKLEEYSLAIIKNPNSDLPELTYEVIGKLIPTYSANKYNDKYIFGRVWQLNEGNFISTWEDPDKVETYKELLINFLINIGIDPDTSKWELRGPRYPVKNDLGGYGDEEDVKYISMDDFFKSNVQQKPDERLPHTVPGLGKALGREAPGFGSYKQGEIASKVKMPFAQYHAMVNQESTEYEL